MNISIVIQFLSTICLIESGLLLVPLFTALLYGETKEAISFLLVILGTIFIVLLLKYLPKKKKTEIYAREGLAIVGLSWIVVSFIGALPFYISGAIPSMVDSFFETVSGFTTTGSSILKEVESLPKSILLWRSFTHWIGGMGILVFMLALAPKEKDGRGQSMHILRAESPGPTIEKLTPRMRSSATILYSIYFGLTLLELLLLLLAGMPFFDSLVNTFATAGTGGFAVLNNSIAGYDSILQQAIITIFMFLFGINFNFYFFILIKKWKKALKMEEVKWYFIIVAVSIIIITFNSKHLFSNVLLAFHHVAFTVSSVITTTGFGTADFNTFPLVSRMILVMLMFCGACAGSTGGGIKVSRIVILVKHSIQEIYKMIHPRTVKIIQIDDKKVDKDTISNIHTYLTIYVLVFVASCMLLAVDNFDITSTVTAVVACLNNIGPGLEMVGTTGNFSAFSDFGKLVLCLDMLIGRLEIFPILALFYPTLWKKRM